jgi:molybdate transport system permease protein
MRKSSRFASAWFLVAPAVLFALLVGLPLLTILLQGISGSLPGILLSPQAGAALRVSLLTSLVSTVAAILLGTPLAYALARIRFWGRAWIELLVDLPIVLPPSVAGLGLLLAFGRRGLLGSTFEFLGIALPFSSTAVVIAQLFVAGPLFVRAARIGFAAIDKQQEEAALAEGASQLQIFRFVMLPAALPALVSGALLCWARALGEFGATILFAGNLIGRTQTMPLAIYTALETNRDVAIALSLLLLFVSAVFLALLRRIEQNWKVA